MTRLLIIYGSHRRVCGMGSWTEALCRQLAEHNVFTTVALVRGRQHHQPESIRGARDFPATIELDTRSGTHAARHFAVARAIRATQPDLVLIASGHACFEGVRRARHAGLTFHTIAVNHGNLPHHLAALAEQQHTLDHIVCVSELSRRAGAESELFTTPLSCIPNGIPLPPSPNPEPTGTTTFRVGFAGRLDPDKGAQHLIPFADALQQFQPDIELLVCGDGPLRSAIAEHPHITWLGALSRDELYATFYPRLTYLAHFAPAESFGLVLAEALAFGVVPICCEFRGRTFDPVLCDPAPAIICPAEDPQAAASALHTLHQNPNQRNQLAQAARTRAESLSETTFGQRWYQRITATLAEPPIQPPPPESLHQRGPFSLPLATWEAIRRLTHRQVPHTTPREEWPPYRAHDTQRSAELSDLFTRLESASCVA